MTGSSEKANWSPQRLRARRRRTRRPSRRTEWRAWVAMPHVRKRCRWRRRPKGKQSAARGTRCHAAAGAARGKRGEEATTQQKKNIAQTEVRMEHSVDETEQGASPSSPSIVNAGGNSLRARGRPHQRVRMGRSPCTISSNRRPDQVTQHKRPESTPFGASRISLLLFPHPWKSRLMRKTSRRIRGAPQRWRGVWTRGRRKIWGQREGIGAPEEEPTWLAGGWRADSAG